MGLRLRAVVFDLDGTLINSVIPFREMKRKVITYLQTNGVQEGLLNEDMLSIEITKLAMDCFQGKGFSEYRISEILSQVTNIMNEFEIQSVDNATLVEGVIQTLHALKRRGLRLGVMTRGCRKYTDIILTKFGLCEFFDAIAARDDVDKPKPDPEHAHHLLKLLGVKPQETLFVGDHWSDAECAKQAGMGFVFVSHGQEVKRVRELGYPIIDNVNGATRFLT